MLLRDPVRLARTLLVPGVIALMLALGGCSSDEGSGTSGRAAGPVRSPGATSDSGSRYLDAGGPLGGLTVETPPVAGR